MKINNKVLFIILFILIILSISGAVFVFQDKVLFLKDWIINIKKGKDKDLNQGPIAQKIPQPLTKISTLRKTCQRCKHAYHSAQNTRTLILKLYWFY